ncbi:hypothetical protein K449DRAFT_390020 [Hypoxylon sp. EC38]|nr:hypothetical protein K449DRAFT_390020 [Hypoxylon sp. EC38]
MATERSVGTKSGTSPGRLDWVGTESNVVEENGILDKNIHWTGPINSTGQDTGQDTGQTISWNLDTNHNTGSLAFPLSPTLLGSTTHTQTELNHGIGPLSLDLATLLAPRTTENIPALFSTSMDTNFESLMSSMDSQQDTTIAPPATMEDHAVPPFQANIGAESRDTNGSEQIIAPSAGGSAETQAQTFRCVLQGCEASAFTSQSQLSEHIARKHTRPHECPQCSRRFRIAKDKDRHVATAHRDTASVPLEDWVCREAKCKRNGKPFSRRDNYTKHLREVHGRQRQGSEGVERRQGVSRSSCESGSCKDNVMVAGSTECFDGGLSKGKRKADELDEGLDDISRGGLVHLLLQERQKSRRLEEELKLYRKREDVHLGILTARFKDT